MDKDFKQLIGFAAFLGLLLFYIVSIVIIPTAYFEKQEFKQQIQCKEVGGTYTYENNNWVCK